LKAINRNYPSLCLMDRTQANTGAQIRIVIYQLLSKMRSNNMLGRLVLLAVLLVNTQLMAGPADIKIGVLGDLSGPFSDSGGLGSVAAAQMAADDFSGTIAGRKIVITSGDHQNRPDIGLNIARQWFDREGVDAIASLPQSAVALAVQNVAREKGRVLLISAGATSDLTGSQCAPYSVVWSDNTTAMSVAAALATAAEGKKSWFFVTADYAFGSSLERDATSTIEAAGGKVVGSVKHPMNSTDFSSYLLTAQASSAELIGFANTGSDFINSIKQAQEFGLPQSGKELVGFLTFLTDIKSTGLNTMQGLKLVSGFYWDQNDEARMWAKRFFDKVGRMPNHTQAATYAVVYHYLKAIKESHSIDSSVVRAEMGRLPGNYFGHPVVIRASGRAVYDMTLYQVKRPEESKGTWDLLKAVRDVSGDKAFPETAERECILGNKSQ
jgi:branched-chain amino acid transport system substrate-binding protein